MKVSVLFVAALRWEAQTIIRHIKVLEQRRSHEASFYHGLAGEREIAVLQTGMGPRLAEQAISWISEIVAPSAVIVTGCAGALVPGLRSGDLLIAEEVVTPPEPPRRASVEWIERYARAALATRLTAMRGRLLATSSVLLEVEEKRRAGSDAGALAVAMEDGAIAAWAAARGVQFASVRVVLDPVEMVIPREISSVAGTKGRVLPSRVLAAIARRPAVVADLVRLGSAQRACRRTLELVHRSVLA